MSHARAWPFGCISHRLTEKIIMATIQTEVIDGVGLNIVTESGTIQVSVAELSESIKAQLILHGLKQKICDAAAIPRNPETGRSATPKEKFDAMQAVAAR